MVYDGPVDINADYLSEPECGIWHIKLCLPWKENVLKFADWLRCCDVVHETLPCRRLNEWRLFCSSNLHKV